MLCDVGLAAGRDPILLNLTTLTANQVTWTMTEAETRYKMERESKTMKLLSLVGGFLMWAFRGNCWLCFILCLSQWELLLDHGRSILKFCDILHFFPTQDCMWSRFLPLNVDHRKRTCRFPHSAFSGRKLWTSTHLCRSFPLRSKFWRNKRLQINVPVSVGTGVREWGVDLQCLMWGLRVNDLLKLVSPLCGGKKYVGSNSWWLSHGFAGNNLKKWEFSCDKNASCF